MHEHVYALPQGEGICEGFSVVISSCFTMENYSEYLRAKLPLQYMQPIQVRSSWGRALRIRSRYCRYTTALACEGRVPTAERCIPVRITACFQVVETTERVALVMQSGLPVDELDDKLSEMDALADLL